MTRYGTPASVDAAIDQARDVRMIEARQHLAFAQEQALLDLRIQAAAQQLDRDLLVGNRRRRARRGTRRPCRPCRAGAAAGIRRCAGRSGFPRGRFPRVSRVACSPTGVSRKPRSVSSAARADARARCVLPDRRHSHPSRRRASARRKIDEDIEQRAQSRQRRIAVLRRWRVVGHSYAFTAGRAPVVSVERRSATDQDMAAVSAGFRAGTRVRNASRG